MGKNSLFTESLNRERGITIKSPRELELMRQAGKVVASIKDSLIKSIKPGMTTQDLDDIAVECINAMGAKPSFKGYLGFPRTICVSINDEIVHGIPGNRIILDGDLVSMDVGAVVGGFHGDSAITVGVGNVSKEGADLISVTQKALDIGIAQAKNNARVGDISFAVQSYIESNGYSVVRQYVGHGIGKALHEEPQIPNFGNPGTGPLLRKGMVIAIEPMVNIGGWDTEVMEDNWTVVTADRSLSAHFEHTLAITDGDADVLTEL
jgi:methionyl aminopeptidase